MDRPKLTPTQVLARLQTRLRKRIAALERVGVDGYGMVIAELRVELDYLKRAQEYLESN